MSHVLSKHNLHTSILFALGASVGASTAMAQDDVDEIIIYGTQGGLDSISGSRLGLSILETPATIDIIDGDAIRDRIDLSVLEAVTRSAGFTNEANPGNGHFSIGARGFTDQNAVTKLYDGTNYYTLAGTVTFPFDTWGVERIEVLKGPASVLYGQGGIGGAINIIPKQPEFESSGDVRVLYGEEDTRFLGLDYTAPLNENLAFRINYSNSESDNWVNNGESDAEMLSLALRWNVTENLALTARYDAGDQNPMRYFGTPVDDGGFISGLTDINFNVDDAEVRYEDDALRFKADWTINDTANLQAEVFSLSSDRFWANAEGYIYDDSSMTVERWDPLILAHDMEHDGYRVNLNLRPMENLQASIGFEANDIDQKRPTNWGPGNPNPIDWDNDFDVVSVNNFQAGSLVDLTSALPMLDSYGDLEQRAIFGEARLEVTGNLAIVGALRYDDFDTNYARLNSWSYDYSSDELTGRLGLVYDATDNTAVYAQMATGAEHPSSSVLTFSGDHREADLVESEQYEIGIKNVVEGTGLQWSVALFDIEKLNLVEDDPNSSNPDDVIEIPEQTSRGIEFGFNYGFTDNLQVHGNFVRLNAETDTGSTPYGVAETTWNLGMAWTVMPAVRVVADARFVDDRKHDATVPLPDYTVVDASLHWQAARNFSLSLKANNLTDEEYASGSYWWGTWLLGQPRTLSLAADFSF